MEVFPSKSDKTRDTPILINRGLLIRGQHGLRDSTRARLNFDPLDGLVHGVVWPQHDAVDVTLLGVGVRQVCLAQKPAREQPSESFRGMGASPTGRGSKK